MKVVYSEAHRRHHPQLYFKAGAFADHPEVPERAERIAAALRKAGHDFIAPDDYGPGARAVVHTPAYLRFLESVHARWRGTGLEGEAVPNAHPAHRMRGRPSGLIGEIGWFCSDLSSPIGPDTFAAACNAANTAVHAAKLVVDSMADGDTVGGAYALCRPPGHHAFPELASGFCFLNNLAIAAEHALADSRGLVRRVAVIDVDVHHGNGTQGVFYRRPDVLTVSLHCDPDDYYPYFSGYATERGEGPGEGYNVNFPLPRGTGDNAYLDGLGDALDVVRVFAPDLLFVALGVDGYEKDPLKGFRLTTGGFGRIARAIGELGLPTVLVQEGGYNTDALGDNVASFLAGFEAGWR